CKREPGLPATCDEHHGLAIGIGLHIDALLLPGLAAELAVEGFPSGPALADLFLETLQLVQPGHELEGPRRLLCQEPHYAEAAPDLRLEPEDALDDVGPRPHYAAGRRAAFGDGKSARHGSALLRHHQFRDIVGTVARRNEPGESEEITPVTIG